MAHDYGYSTLENKLIELFFPARRILVLLKI